MKIWVDLDEVLAQFLVAYLEYQNNTYGTNYKFKDVSDYDVWKVRGGTREQIVEKVYDFHKTPYFANIKPIEWALPVLKRLKKDHELYLITSRQDSVKEQTKLRINKYFPDIFSDLFFVNHFSTEWSQRKKSDVCNEVGIDVMIEDSLIYAEDCAVGERKVLLCNRPWNQAQTISPNIQRVQDRNEIDSLI